MKKTWLGIVAAALLLHAAGCSNGKLPLPELDAGTRAELTGWLDQHRASPEEYVVSKFKDHDIVLLGEYHRIRHDPVLVQKLIPVLHANGVRILGTEFARRADQDAIDRLLSGASFDEALAKRIAWNQWPMWGYREYIDILRAAWRFNWDLPKDTEPFRVLGLNARMDWSHVWTEEDRDDPEVMKKVFPDGEPDDVMAKTILDEIVAKGRKALIYAGASHAYTRFRQPIVNQETGELVRRISNRMGNQIYAAIGDRAFLIFLHAPWPSVVGDSAPEVYPADGVIDALFARMPSEDQRAGFDIVGSPFGRLPAQSSLWSHAADDFRLEMYCDGWIHQKPLSQYEGVRAVEGWFDSENIAEAIAQISNPNPRVKDRNRTVEQMTSSMMSAADIGRRFARFH